MLNSQKLNQYKYVRFGEDTAYHSSRRLSEPRISGNNFTLNIPLPQRSNRKDSFITNSTNCPEIQSGRSSYKQAISTQTIGSTSSDQKIISDKNIIAFDEKLDNINDRSHLRTAFKYPPAPNKDIIQVNQKINNMRLNEPTIQSARDRNNRIIQSRQMQIMRLKKENADLKRRLSLKQQCVCKSPYIQQQVQYLRHNILNHMDKYHSLGIKSSRLLSNKGQ